MKNQRFRTLLSVLLVMTLLGSFCSCASEADYTGIPDASDAFYVYEELDVLTDDTAAHIINLNRALYEATGAQIVVACIRTSGTTDLADYAPKMFNKWGIGSAEKNNGLLLLLSIEEDDYWALPGKGLEDILPSGTIKLMLNEYLEPYFAQRDYDSGVRALFDVLLSHLTTAYGVTLNPDSSSGSYETTEPVPPVTDNNIGNVLGIVIWILVAIVLVIFLLTIFSACGGNGTGSGGSGGGRRKSTYYSAPPRHYSGYSGGYPTSRPPSSRPSSRPSGGMSRPSSRPTGGMSRPTSRPSGGMSRPTSRPSGGMSRPSSRPTGGVSRGGGGISRGGGAGRR